MQTRMMSKVGYTLLLVGTCFAQITHADNRRLTPRYMLERTTLLAQQFRAQIENDARLKEELLDNEEDLILTTSDDLFNNILHQAAIRANKENILEQATRLLFRLESLAGMQSICDEELAQLQRAYRMLRITAQECVPNYILPPSQVE